MLAFVTRGEAIALCLALNVALAAAQTNLSPSATDGSQRQSAGWTFTPALVYANTWDDNVFVRGRGDHEAGDVVKVVNPRADLGYIRRRASLDARYDGAFLAYRHF